MSLTKKDIDIITEIILQLSNKHNIDEEITRVQIEAISKSVEINTKIFTEIKAIADNNKQILLKSDELVRKITNGMDEQLGDMHNYIVKEYPKLISKIDQVYNDVSSKDGYLPKISNKLDFFWIPLLATLLSMALIIIRVFKG